MANPPLQIPLAPNTNFWDNASVYLVAPQDLTPDNNNPGNQVPSGSAQKLNQVQVNHSYVPVVEVTAAEEGASVQNVVAQVLILKPSLIAGGNVTPALFNPNLIFSSSDQNPVTVAANKVQPIACWQGGVANTAWNVTASDLASADPGGHVCLAATSYLSTDEQSLQLNPFFPVGSTNGNPWQGQRNIHIAPSGGSGHSRRLRYDFFAANPHSRGDPLNVTVALIRTDPGDALSAADLKVLKESPLGQLTFRPSPHRPTGVTLKHRAEKRGFLGMLLGLVSGPPQAAAGPTPSPVPGDIVGRIGVRLVPGRLGGLTFSMNLDPSEQPGNVQVLSLIQFDPSGKVMAGIRVLGVVI
jgi:hypothetical protein